MFCQPSVITGAAQVLRPTMLTSPKCKVTDNFPPSILVQSSLDSVFKLALTGLGGQEVKIQPGAP